MRMLQKGANYRKQEQRIKKFNKTGGTRSGQIAQFAKISRQLVMSGGEDKSNLTCGGSTTAAGAVSLKAAVATLDTCDKNISAACNSSSYELPSDMAKVGYAAVICNDNY